MFVVKVQQMHKYHWLYKTYNIHTPRVKLTMCNLSSGNFLVAINLSVLGWSEANQTIRDFSKVQRYASRHEQNDD